MFVHVYWSIIESEDDGLLGESYCLYAYFYPSRSKITYVGQAYRHTVRQRLGGEHKRKLFGRIVAQGCQEPFALLHGVLKLEPGRRMSLELLTDVETLLIKRLNPPWNTQARKTRVARSGMVVICRGEWPLQRKRFVDV
jgi:hypothetical protein